MKNQDKGYRNIFNFINNNYWTKGLVDRILQLNSIMTCNI